MQTSEMNVTVTTIKLLAIVVAVWMGSVHCQVAGGGAGERTKRAAGNRNAGLIPFPRNGRSPGVGGLRPGFLQELANAYDAASDTDFVHESKRQNLMAFPRVGRSNHGYNGWPMNDLVTAAQKKSIDNGIPAADELSKCFNNCAKKHTLGLWWGPRLGRVQKRSFGALPDVRYVPSWALVALSDLNGASGRSVDYTPRLGRESEEDLNDGDELPSEGSSATRQQ